MMKKELTRLISRGLFLCLTTIVSTTTPLAFADCNSQPPLNEVTFRLSAEEWVQTTSAKLMVEIHATLDKKTLAQMRQQIMVNLNKIAQGNWHITNFERSQDNSGLEKLYVVAEARVNESALTNVNTEAEKLSEPGVKYKIQNIDFTPSMADMEKAKMDLRKTIYHDAQAEITTLNSVYPAQKYVLHGIQFGEYVTANGMRAMPMVMMATGAGSQRSSDNNVVSNLVKLSADVNIASKDVPALDKS
jgi:hypothetical protein